MSILRAGMLFVLDQYAPVLITAALVLYVPSVLGQRLGFWLQGRISARKLHRAVLVVLLVASANLLWRGIGGLLPR
jgi:uncharacterized membrane protein YfcA